MPAAVESIEALVGGLRASVEHLTREITSGLTTLNAEVRSLREWRHEAAEDQQLARSTARLVERMDGRIEKLEGRALALELAGAADAAVSEGVWRWVGRWTALLMAAGTGLGAIASLIWWLSRALPGAPHP